MRVLRKRAKERSGRNIKGMNSRGADRGEGREEACQEGTLTTKKREGRDSMDILTGKLETATYRNIQRMGLHPRKVSLGKKK